MMTSDYTDSPALFSGFLVLQLHNIDKDKIK